MGDKNWLYEQSEGRDGGGQRQTYIWELLARPCLEHVSEVC